MGLLVSIRLQAQNMNYPYLIPYVVSKCIIVWQNSTKFIWAAFRSWKTSGLLCIFCISLYHLFQQVEDYTLQINEMKELFRKKSGDFDMIQDGMKKIEDFQMRKTQMEQELSDVRQRFLVPVKTALNRNLISIVWPYQCVWIIAVTMTFYIL